MGRLSKAGHHTDPVDRSAFSYFTFVLLKWGRVGNTYSAVCNVFLHNTERKDMLLVFCLWIVGYPHHLIDIAALYVS